jgi:hypothetical protein
MPGSTAVESAASLPAGPPDVNAPGCYLRAPVYVVEATGFRKTYSLSLVRCGTRIQFPGSARSSAKFLKSDGFAW